MKMLLQKYHDVEMDVISGGLETSPAVWKFLRGMFRQKFYNVVEMDVPSGGLETSREGWRLSLEL
jgi:hypothetical protein